MKALKRLTSFVCEASFLAEVVVKLSIAFVVGHCFEVIDHTAIIGGDSIKAIGGVDFFCLTLTNILNDRIENVVSAVVHAHEKEFDTVGNVVNEICYMVKLKFTEILCFGYQCRVDNEEERKCKDTRQ